MAKIHTPGDGYTAPLPNSGYEWQEYADEKKKRVIEQALFILRHNVRGSKPCNHCFQKLPGGRTFDDILNDDTVVISYSPGNQRNDFGATLGKDVTITEFSIRMGRWTVAATLVHEFGHVNGAPGTDHQAEGTLICCGFSALHNANIIGAVPGPGTNEALA
jgi:hypothetical protein